MENFNEHFYVESIKFVLKCFTIQNESFLKRKKKKFRGKMQCAVDAINKLFFSLISISAAIEINVN